MNSTVNRVPKICIFSDIFKNLEIASFKDDLFSGYFQLLIEFKNKQKNKDSRCHMLRVLPYDLSHLIQSKQDILLKCRPFQNLPEEVIL